MHDTAMNHAKLFKNFYANPLFGDANGAKIVDLGASDFNGSLRPVFDGFEYVGIDLESGPNVGLVMSDPYSLPIEDRSVDVVVASSVFEHADFFWLTFLEMVRVCKPGGLIYINAPSNGFFHRYPRDSWRFYPDSSLALRDWAEVHGFDISLLESFIGPRGAEGWMDFVAIFQVADFPTRKFELISNKVEATNVRTPATSPDIQNLQEDTHLEVSLATEFSQTKAQLDLTFEELSNTKKSLLNRDLEIKQLNSTLSILRSQNEHQGSLLKRFKDREEELLNSKSWRVTEPLRLLYRLLLGSKT